MMRWLETLQLHDFYQTVQRLAEMEKQKEEGKKERGREGGGGTSDEPVDDKDSDEEIPAAKKPCHDDLGSNALNDETK